MSHCEAFEARRLFSVTGLDLSFADAGTLTMPANTAADGTALAVTSATWVDAVAGRKHFLYKFDGSGRPDSSWGVDGRIRLGVFDVTQLAYDRRSNTLYAAGIDSDGKTLRVARYNSNGSTDTTYGDAGVFSYTATAPTPELMELKYSVSLAVDQLTPLPRGKLLVTYSRATRRIDETSDILWASDQNELAIMRLTSTGRRDTTFGTAGQRTVLTDRSSYEVHGIRSYTKIPKLGEIQPRADGGYRVVASEAFLRTEGTPGNVVHTSKSFTVFSRTVTPAGQVDTASSATWSLTGTETDGKQRQMHDLGVFANGDSGAIVIGQITGGRTPTLAQRFILSPNQRPTAVGIAIASGATLAGFIPAAGGAYFAIADGADAGVRQATRLTPAFFGDRHFGVKGTDYIDPTPALAYLPDADGRLLILTATSVRRFE